MADPPDKSIISPDFTHLTRIEDPLGGHQRLVIRAPAERQRTEHHPIGTAHENDVSRVSGSGDVRARHHGSLADERDDAAPRNNRLLSAWLPSGVVTSRRDGSLSPGMAHRPRCSPHLACHGAVMAGFRTDIDLGQIETIQDRDSLPSGV
jgi:hypothetical protein